MTARQKRPRAPRPLTRGERVIAFIERFCRIPEGKGVGEPMVLLPFQREFILAVYDNPAGTSRAYLSIARKNGKSALIAAICLAHIAGPEAVTNTQIISGARSRDQAALVYKLMEKMIGLSPELQKVTRTVASTKIVRGLARNVEFKSISAEGRTAHGLSPVVAILDEVGQITGPQDAFVDAIETAQGAHENPILFAISTQAPSDADLFSIWLDDAEKSNDPRIVSHVHAAPADCKLTSRRAWKAANPALGKFRSLKDLEGLAERATRMPSSEPSFRNLNLNQRVVSVAPFVSRSVWESTGAPPDLSVFQEVPVYAGLDLSARTDLTALVLIAFDGALWHCLPYFWTPKLGLRERSARDRAPYDVWVDQGHINTTPGASIDYEFVVADVMEIIAGMNIAAIGFDRWRIDIMKKEFERAGADVPLVEFGQGFKDMSPALDALESVLLNGNIRHGMNPVLTMCAANASVDSDAAGNRKFTKQKSTGRIDGMVALAMALGMTCAKEPESLSHEQVVFDLNAV